MLASVQFCVGPLTILGAIRDGLSGDYSLLAIKAVLDGFSAIIFASTFGLGTLFAGATLLLIQGSLSLLAGLLKPLLVTMPHAGMGEQPRVIELAAVGGVILTAPSLFCLVGLSPRGERVLVDRGFDLLGSANVLIKQSHLPSWEREVCLASRSFLLHEQHVARSTADRHVQQAPVSCPPQGEEDHSLSHSASF